MNNEKVEYSEYSDNFKTIFQPHKRQSSTLLPASVFGNLNFQFISQTTKMHSFGVYSPQLLNAMRSEKVLGHG